jgi:hypothetical protein
MVAMSGPLQSRNGAYDTVARVNQGRDINPLWKIRKAKGHTEWGWCIALLDQKRAVCLGRHALGFTPMHRRTRGYRSVRIAGFLSGEVVKRGVSAWT